MSATVDPRLILDLTFLLSCNRLILGFLGFLPNSPYIKTVQIFTH